MDTDTNAGATPSGTVGADVLPHRCRYEIVRESSQDFPLTNGRPSGTRRIWQTRRCLICGATSGRWLPRQNTILFEPRKL